MHRSTGGRQYFHNRGGGLGWGMPAAVGVSLAHDHAPVLCLVGDGSALYSPQALWSAVHEETPVVYVILNNLEYGILKNTASRCALHLTDRHARTTGETTSSTQSTPVHYVHS